MIDVLVEKTSNPTLRVYYLPIPAASVRPLVEALPGVDDVAPKRRCGLSVWRYPACAWSAIEASLLEVFAKELGECQLVDYAPGGENRKPAAEDPWEGKVLAAAERFTSATGCFRTREIGRELGLKPNTLKPSEMQRICRILNANGYGQTVRSVPVATLGAKKFMKYARVWARESDIQRQPRTARGERQS